MTKSKFYEMLLDMENKTTSEEFWDIYINYIEKKLNNYFLELKDNGLDPVLLKSVSKNDLEESTPEKLKSLKETMIALSKLNQVFKNKSNKEEVENLREEIKIKDEKLEEQSMRMAKAKEVVEKYKKENKLKKKQVITELNKKLKVLRERIGMINENVAFQEEPNKDELEKIQNNVGDAVETMVTILSEANLWPEGEAKPERKVAEVTSKKDNKGDKKEENPEKEESEDIEIQQQSFI